MKLERAIYEAALDRFGGKMQMMICIEEMAELQKAIIKHLRNPTEDTHNNIIEEIADVSLMIDQMRIMFDVNIIEKIRQEKLERLQKRIEESHDRQPQE